MLGGPDPRGNVQPLEGAVEEDGALPCPVIQGDLETAAGGDEELVTVLVGVSAAGFAARDVVQVKYPADREWNRFLGLDDRQVATVVLYLAEPDDGAVIYRSDHWNPWNNTGEIYAPGDWIIVKDNIWEKSNWKYQGTH